MSRIRLLFEKFGMGEFVDAVVLMLSDVLASLPL